MIIQNYSNWLSWSYNNQECGLRNSRNDVYKFSINLSKIDLSYGSYQEELYKTASLMRDVYTGKFDVLLSGGIDSEVIVRVFKDLKIKHNTFIFKYENNLNYQDVCSAKEICCSLNIPYKIIDFNVKKFFETDAYDIFKKTKSLKAARLPQLRFIELIDNIPILGNGEPYWKQQADLSWKFSMAEHEHNLSSYCQSIGRSSICDWYEFHPNILLSFKEHPIIQQLIKNQIPGKKSSWSSRVKIHQEIWPDIKEKPKLVGFEGNNSPGYYPEYIIEMQKYIECELGNGQNYWYSLDEFNKLFYSIV